MWMELDVEFGMPCMCILTSNYYVYESDGQTHHMLPRSRNNIICLKQGSCNEAIEDMQVLVFKHTKSPFLVVCRSSSARNFGFWTIHVSPTTCTVQKLKNIIIPSALKISSISIYSVSSEQSLRWITIMEVKAC
jgi:hypothetical protein